MSSICQSFPFQNFEITNSPKFYPARILRYTVFIYFRCLLLIDVICYMQYIHAVIYNKLTAVVILLAGACKQLLYKIEALYIASLFTSFTQ